MKKRILDEIDDHEKVLEKIFIKIAAAKKQGKDAGDLSEMLKGLQKNIDALYQRLEFYKDE